MRLDYHRSGDAWASRAAGTSRSVYNGEIERLLKASAQSGNVESMRELADLLTASAGAGSPDEERIAEGLLWYENAASCLDQKARVSWEELKGRRLRVTDPRSNYVLLHAALSLITVICLFASRVLGVDLIAVALGLFIAWQLSLAAFELYYSHELSAANEKSGSASWFFRPSLPLTISRLVLGFASLVAGYALLASQGGQFAARMLFLLAAIAINVINFLNMYWTKRRSGQTISNIAALATNVGAHERKFAELVFVSGVVSTAAVTTFATYFLR